MRTAAAGCRQFGLYIAELRTQRRVDSHGTPPRRDRRRDPHLLVSHHGVCGVGKSQREDRIPARLTGRQVLLISVPIAPTVRIGTGLVRLARVDLPRIADLTRGVSNTHVTVPGGLGWGTVQRARGRLAGRSWQRHGPRFPPGASAAAVEASCRTHACKDVLDASARRGMAEPIPARIDRRAWSRRVPQRSARSTGSERRTRRYQPRWPACGRASTIRLPAHASD